MEQISKISFAEEQPTIDDDKLLILNSNLN